jgi:GAF domain-containing protein
MRQMDRDFILNLVRLACEGARAVGSTLFLVDGDYLRPYLIYNLPKEYVEGIGPVRIGTQCCGRAVAHKRPWVVADMLTDPLFSDGIGGSQNSPIRAGFSVPIFNGDHVIGSLGCHYKNPYTPTPWDIERNESFAKLIGIALQELRGIAPSAAPADDDSDEIKQAIAS